MSNTYSLEDLKKDLDVEFAPVRLTLGDDEFVLRNMMRLPDSQRTAVLTAMQVVGNDTDKEDAEAVNRMSHALTEILTNLPDDNKGSKLVEFVGGDLSFGLKILSLWTEHTQPGEAQNSPA
jgi:hypothetical protein